MVVTAFQQKVRMALYTGHGGPRATSDSEGQKDGGTGRCPSHEGAERGRDRVAEECLEPEQYTLKPSRPKTLKAGKIDQLVGKRAK